MQLNENERAERFPDRRPRRRRRNAAEVAGRQRWMRDLEPFEDRAYREPFPGATVLEDMEEETGRDDGLTVLARYAVIRVLLLCAAGVLAGPRLRTEQRVALGHLALLPRRDWERHSLERLATSCRDLLTPEALHVTQLCAESAGRRGHVMGSFALFRAAYETSLAREWWDEAADAAHGISVLATATSAPRSARVWGWRYRVLQARHVRQREAEAEAKAAAEAEAKAAAEAEASAAAPAVSPGLPSAAGDTEEPGQG
jgi:hypothetical protein